MWTLWIWELSFLMFDLDHTKRQKAFSITNNAKGPTDEEMELWFQTYE